MATQNSGRLQEGHFCQRASRTSLREQENGEQHVTDQHASVDSMLHLHRTLVLCFWCFLLLHSQAVADEEAFWGPTPPRENSSENKSRWFWTPSLPKMPSLPSLPFNIPFMSSSNNKDEASVVTTTVKAVTEPINHLQDSGSGEGSSSEASELSTASTQGPLTSVAKIRTESLPTGTSDSPYSSIAQTDNDSLVPGSHSPTSSSIRSALFTNSPTSTNAPEQNATHTRPRQGTTQAAGPSMGATTQHLPEENTDKEVAEDFTGEITSTIAPETTVPTALTWAAAQTTTTNPGLVETTLPSRHPLRPITPTTSSETTLDRKAQGSTVSITLRTEEATVAETQPTQSETDPAFSEARSGPVEEQQGVITTAMGIDHRQALESITSTTQSQRVNFPIAGELPGKEDKEDEETEEGVVPSAADGHADTRRLADITTPSAKLLTTSLPLNTGIPSETPHIPLYTEDWTSNPEVSDITFLPDCNKERTGICNLSDTWYTTTTTSNFRPTQNTTATNQTVNPFLIPAPPMLVPLYTDWNSAMAAWGLAWEAHVYGAGCVFAILTLASALNLLCLPLRCPSGCGYFALVSLFLLAAGCTRSFSLLYDAYGHQDRLPSAEASLMLYEAPFPCLTAAFGLVFLLLSMRSRMQLSYSAFQRPCFLACLVVLHLLLHLVQWHY
ncbi:hypothetical protein INR49_012293 [Caranx melampygus]|nr:hypothetical protein INR49_012293 [Caranx melampygus]